MDYIIKKALSLTSEEKTNRGITGIPDNWPIEKYPYVDSVPENFELISEEDLEILIDSNQISYDVWLQSLRPVMTPISNIQQVSVQNQPNVTISNTPAFDAKTVIVRGVTYNLYIRCTGIQQALTQGANTITFTIPYNWVKFLGMEGINCESLDTVDLYVLDSTTGTYTGYPNAVLQKFGYTVNLAKDYYKRTSDYDADLKIGMQIKAVYNSVSAKTVGVNFILHEVL